jgi:hypothetical protein
MRPAMNDLHFAERQPAIGPEPAIRVTGAAAMDKIPLSRSDQ